MKTTHPLQNQRPSGPRLSLGGYWPLRSAAGRVFLGAVLSACLSLAAFAGVIYVVPGGTGNGSSWASGKDLASALSGAASGSELWVKAGIYKPTTGADRNATFQLKSGVALYGGFAGTETLRTQRNSNPATNSTFLSGDLAGNDLPHFVNYGDNSLHLVTGSGTDNTAILDGFIITGGNSNGNGVAFPEGFGGGMLNSNGSPTVTNVTFSGNSASVYGGGISNFNQSSPTLANVTFNGNSASNGAGISNHGLCSPALTNVIFSGNSVSYYGAGIFNTSQSNPTLIDVTFSGNTAALGGGIYNYESSPTLTDVTFSGNSAPSGGGGIFNFESSPTLTRVTFSGNFATYGGGLYNTGGTPALTNVTFSGNSGWYGGGMFNHGGIPALTNVTFSGNSADFVSTGDHYGYGGGMYNQYANPTLTNVTFINNSAPSVYGAGGGLYNLSGSPTLAKSTFVNNSAGSGAGINNDWDYESTANPALIGVTFINNSTLSGVIYTDGGDPILTDVTFSGNSGATIVIGTNTGGNPALTNVTFSGNSATDGALIHNYQGNPTLTNVTFSGNSAFSMIYTQAVDTTLTNVTLSGNSGTAVTNDGGAINLRNCILWGNGAEIYSINGGNASVSNSIVQGGYVGTNVLNVDPKLGPLQNNGGATFTMVPQPGSPAIDAASPNLAVTIAPVAAGRQSVTVTDSHALAPESLVAIFDPGQTVAEVVRIESIPFLPVYPPVRGNSFTATFAQAHPAGAEVILATDQRGFERPVNNRNDIGAVEAAYTTLTGPANPPAYGQSFNVTATVANATATGQEKVQFVVDGVNHGSPVTLVNGSATKSFTGLTATSHQITAIYTNGGGSPEGNSSTLTQQVTKATPTISWGNPPDITYGTALSGTQLNASTSVPGSFVYSPAATTVLPAGNGQTLSVTFTPTDTTNYATATKNVTINVLKATPAISWGNPADITYGTPLSGTQLNASASVPGTFVYNPAATTVLPAGNGQTLSVTFTPTDTANYATATKSVTINVLKASPVLTWNSPADITYGTALSGTQLSASASVPGTFVYNPAATTVLPAGNGQTLSVTFTPTDTANYTSATKSVTINVLKASPVLTWNNPADITYGTALSGTQLNASASVPGAFVYSPAATTVLPAGNGQTLSVTFTPTDTANYTSATKSVTINVLKASPVLTWNSPADITYGTALSGTQLNASTPIAGAFVYSPAATTVLPAGNGQTLSVTFTPTDTANYTTATKSVIINVLKATPVLTWNNPADITYGTALSGTQLNASASVPGTFVYNPAANTVLNAGNGQTLSVTFTPTDTANYKTCTKTVTINVLKASPVLTWNNPADITYGTPLSATQLNAGASVPGAFVYNPAATTVLPASNGQTLSVTFTPTDTANYATATKSVTINVLKASPVLTWNNPADITYGTALSGTQLNASAPVAGAFVYSQAATTVLPAGNGQTLSVTFTPTDTANYTTATKSVIINVLKATPVIYWSNPPNITYGTPLSATQLNATVSPSIAGTFTYNPSATTVLNAGSGQTLSVSFAPTDTNNYNPPANKSVTINVIQAPATIALTNLTQAYDGTPKPVTANTNPAGLSVVTTTYTGISPTSYPTSTSAPTAMGSYSVVATLTNANYTASPATGTLLIQKLTATVTVTSSKNPSAFGDAVKFTATIAPAVSGTVQFKIDGVNFGSPVTVANGTAVSGNTATLAVGNRAITAIFTSTNSSYSGSTGSLTQTVAVPVKITGGGTLSAPTHFGFNVQPAKAGTSASGYKGHLHFRDTSVTGGFLFKATSFTGEYASDSIHATFSGDGKLNDVTGYTFVVTVEDRAKQGAGNDKFRIVINNPNGSLRYDSNAQAGVNGGLLTGGKVKIHYSADTFPTASLYGSGAFVSNTLNFDIDVRKDATGGFNAGAGVQVTDTTASSFVLTTESITSMVKNGNVVTVTGAAMYNSLSGFRVQLDWDTNGHKLQVRIYDATNKQVYDSKSVTLNSGSITYVASL